jgi:hypothetical protein
VRGQQAGRGGPHAAGSAGDNSVTMAARLARL